MSRFNLLLAACALVATGALALDADALLRAEQRLDADDSPRLTFYRELLELEKQKLEHTKHRATQECIHTARAMWEVCYNRPWATKSSCDVLTEERVRECEERLG
jgi:hypothetical protein